MGELLYFKRRRHGYNHLPMLIMGHHHLQGVLSRSLHIEYSRVASCILKRHWNPTTYNPPLLVRLRYFRRNMWIPWLLMAWFLASPGQQQLWYWPCRVKLSLSLTMNRFHYSHHLSVEKCKHVSPNTCSAMRNDYLRNFAYTVQWRHNERDGVSNHQPHDCLLNGLFRRKSKKTSKLRVTGLCEGNSPVTGEFPAHRANNAENVSIWWRHHEHTCPPLSTSQIRLQPPALFTYHRCHNNDTSLGSIQTLPVTKARPNSLAALKQYPW